MGGELCLWLQAVCLIIISYETSGYTRGRLGVQKDEQHLAQASLDLPVHLQHSVYSTCDGLVTSGFGNYFSSFSNEPKCSHPKTEKLASLKINNMYPAIHMQETIPMQDATTTGNQKLTTPNTHQTTNKELLHEKQELANHNMNNKYNFFMDAKNFGKSQRTRQGRSSEEFECIILMNENNQKTCNWDETSLHSLQPKEKDNVIDGIPDIEVEITQEVEKDPTEIMELLRETKFHKQAARPIPQYNHINFNNQNPQILMCHESSYDSGSNDFMKLHEIETDSVNPLCHLKEDENLRPIPAKQHKSSLNTSNEEMHVVQMERTTPIVKRTVTQYVRQVDTPVIKTIKTAEEKHYHKYDELGPGKNSMDQNKTVANEMYVQHNEIIDAKKAGVSQGEKRRRGGYQKTEGNTSSLINSSPENATLFTKSTSDIQVPENIQHNTNVGKQINADNTRQYSEDKISERNGSDLGSKCHFLLEYTDSINSFPGVFYLKVDPQADSRSAYYILTEDQNRNVHATETTQHQSHMIDGHNLRHLAYYDDMSQHSVPTLTESNLAEREEKKIQYEQTSEHITEPKTLLLGQNLHFNPQSKTLYDEDEEDSEDIKSSYRLPRGCTCEQCRKYGDMEILHSYGKPQFYSVSDDNAGNMEQTGQMDTAHTWYTPDERHDVSICSSQYIPDDQNLETYITETETRITPQYLAQTFHKTPVKLQKQTYHDYLTATERHNH